MTLRTVYLSGMKNAAASCGSDETKGYRNMFKTPKTKWGIFLKNAVIILLSAFCGASVQIFVMIPNGMSSGGLPGIVRIISHFLPFVSYSVIYYAFQMLILVFALVTMGKKEVSRIIALSFVYPIMLFFFERSGYVFLDSPDPFLAAVLIGIFYGLASGIGYIGGYSSGGIDTVARIIKYKWLNHVPVGNISLAFDVVVIAISAFVFNTNVAIYAGVTAFISAKIISAVMLGANGRFVQFDIISSEPEKISDFIMKDIGRAATSYVSRGEYSHEERRMVSVICTPGESIKIKKFIADVDPKAFATIRPITTVWGMDESFSNITEIDNN